MTVLAMAQFGGPAGRETARVGGIEGLPASEEEVALTILNALDEAGFEVVSQEQRSG